VNRCSQVIADQTVSSLAKLIQDSHPIRLDHLSFNSSLKYLCLRDPAISIDIISPTQFEVVELAAGAPVACGPAISSARLADFFMGATRVKRQYEAALKLKEAGAAAAWTLISAYYCAFFAGLELAKTLGRFSMSFETDEMQTLAAKATGRCHADFFRSGQTNFSGIEYAGKLVFQSSGTRPHVAAWNNATYAVTQMLNKRAWGDAERFLELLKSPNCSPSAIRNAWNYKRSDLYGPAGEREAQQFRKLLGNHHGAYLWMSQRKQPLPHLEPCAIAALCEGLSVPVVDASSKAKELLRTTASSN
jgi:hypothetical protein